MGNLLDILLEIGKEQWAQYVEEMLDSLRYIALHYVRRLKSYSVVSVPMYSFTTAIHTTFPPINPMNNIHPSIPFPTSFPTSL